MKLWLSLRYHGLDAFRTAIQQDLDHAQRLAASVRECAELELVAVGELSAVCFRYLMRPDASDEERNRFNTDLMKRIVRRGKVSPLELVDAAIARIEQWNGALNAVVTSTFDLARDMATSVSRHGAFAGVPFLLKDFGTEWTGVRFTGAKNCRARLGLHK